jgi:hypothetical protein
MNDMVHRAKFFRFQWPYGIDDCIPIKKNYKLQNTNYKQITNYNVLNYKQEINKKLLQGVQGDGFLEKSPPGRRRQEKYHGNRKNQTNLRGKEKAL